MAGSNYSYESEFYSWLSDRIKPAQLSSVYEAFAQVNKFCLLRKVLTRPLFETDDINVLKAIQQTIDYNKIFRFTHRRYQSEMSAGIRQYIEYIKTHRKEETVPLDTTGKVLPPQEAKPVSMDPLISLILDAQIEFIDHRDKGGALWILGAENNKSFVNKCAQRGIVFRFKPEGSRATGGTAAWWTKYGTEKTPAKETDMKSSEPVNTDHSSEVLLPFRFNFQVQEQPVDANGEKIQPVSHNHDTEVVELLRDSIFDPLCEALAEEHVYTIEDLKKIRLWPFMNQHNLYTIATRQIVLTRVRELLSPVMQVEDGRLFRLHCGDAIYEGETASIAFLRYCENLAHRFPLKIRTLLGKNAPGSSLVALHQTNIQGNPLKMENPTAYIQEDLTSEDILLLAAWLGKACGCLSNDIKIEGQELSTMAPETLSQKQSDTAPPLQKLSAPARENKCSAMDQLMINKMESAVMQSDMTGLDFDELRDILRETMTETKRLVALAKHIVEIKGRLYHEDALIDWTEGADQLESIMDKLMQKNNGYISAAQLYEYAHADMNMFLNDNDINDVRSVYDIAQHLFEKNAYHGKRYAFTGKSHIATSSDVSTNFEVIATCINSRPEEIYFTSGGTESDNWAIKGSTSYGDHCALITSEFEHHAVLNSCKKIEELGYPVVYLHPTKEGFVMPELLERFITDKTKLVSIMMVNNEIGTIQPIKDLCMIAHSHGAFFHTDAVQALGHITVDVKELDIDMLSCSAHKFNGPKGIGFLYIKSGTPLYSYMDGGGQEASMRAGTENIASIVGMAVALKKNVDRMADSQKRLKALEKMLLDRLNDASIQYIRNGKEPQVPGNLSLSFPCTNGELLLHRLDLLGIMVSTGSACDSKNTQISHVLQAIEADEQYAVGTIRISLGYDNQPDEVIRIADALIKILCKTC